MEKKRTRNFATVIYPESAPENWKLLLQEQCVPALVSPIYDRDINTDGTIKKEHYHVMIRLVSDKYSAMGEMIDFCIENGVDSYAQLLLYAKK